MGNLLWWPLMVQGTAPLAVSSMAQGLAEVGAVRLDRWLATA